MGSYVTAREVEGEEGGGVGGGGGSGGAQNSQL